MAETPDRRAWADNGGMDAPGPHPGDARNDTGPAAPITREARVLVSCGLIVLFGGPFLAVFSDNRLSLFMSIAMAVTGALMALPHMVAAAISRR